MHFHTIISKQALTIDNETFTAKEMAIPAADKQSALQTIFRERYGNDSFQASLADFLAEWFSPADTLWVQTSGSTGTPKRMQVEKRRMMNSAMLTVSFLNLQENDDALLCMPLKYIAGKMVVVRALIAKLRLVLISPCGHPLENIGKIPAFAAMIPLQIYNSLKTPAEKERLKQIRHLIIGGGAIEHSMEEELKNFPYDVWSTYGMTETLSHIALRKLSGYSASEWYTPFSNVTLSSAPDGTLIIDAPSVCSQRLGTNDIVEFNSQGQFRVLGRKDNTINTGGVKVQIEQIEAALYPYMPLPFQITSAPDPKFGERIVLLIEGCTKKITPELEGIMGKAFDKLPAYWRPKQIVFVASLPMTETGKPDRAAAKQLVLQ